MGAPVEASASMSPLSSMLLLVWLVSMVTVHTIREAVCLSMSRGLDPVLAWEGFCGEGESHGLSQYLSLERVHSSQSCRGMMAHTCNPRRLR